MQQRTAEQSETVTDIKLVRHMRQILLWPVYLLPLDEDAPIQDHWEHLAKPSPANPWRELDDEFGDPDDFQERHYNEFVSFLPPVQRFLYGQGIGARVRRTYGESPIKVMRRTDMTKVRVTIEQGSQPVELGIAHVDLYFYFDVDIAILTLEIFAEDVPFTFAQELLFRFGRAYPAYWESGGRGGHCVWKVEWLGADGRVLAQSDYEKREKYLSFACKHRAPAVASHWEYLMSPLVLSHSDKEGLIRYRQLEYYRMPLMAYLALEEPHRLTRSDQIRIGLGIESGEPYDLPYSHDYLKDFESRYCYDRYTDSSGTTARFIVTGATFVVLGETRDRFYMDAIRGMLGRFRHQHFLLFMIAHFQKAALRMFSNRLVAAVSELDITNLRAHFKFRRNIRHALENFLRFAHRYWFHEISNQVQTRELFELTRRHLDLDGAYAEVREELQDMGNFLDVEAMRRQNETMVRLTVVTTFGLIGTVTTGFLGMNLFAWSEQTTEWRLIAFGIVFSFMSALTLYAVLKSRRLSEFLDALADEQVSMWGKVRALFRVWSRN